MDEQIRIDLAYAEERKKEAVRKQNEARKLIRRQNELELVYQYHSQWLHNSGCGTEKTSQPQPLEQVIHMDENHYQSNDQSLDNDASSVEDDLNEDSDAPEFDIIDTREDFDIGTLYADHNLPDITSQSPVPLTRLHHFTNISTIDYCRNLARFLRDAKICKSLSNQLISNIKSGLPHPNYLPCSTDELYRLMNVTDLFTRRSVCIICQLELPCDTNTCPQCRSTDQKTLAVIFDVDLHQVLSLLLRRLSKNIEEYKEKILQGNPEQLNDIIFNKLYRRFVSKFHNENIISLVLHLDGVGLTNSTNLKLWLFSGSIVELPPSLRYRRFNMPLLSIWVGHTEPLINLWLDTIIDKLNRLKLQSINVSPDLQYKLKCFAVTGDCPAMRLALSFVGHGGYSCCWLCYVPGVHVVNKRQYYCELPIRYRDPKTYLEESVQASTENRDINGHRGISILHTVLDTQLPQAIIIDYLHCTLLGHGKTIIRSVYRKLKPDQRISIDSQIKQQNFPHFFGRKTRPIADFAHVKATEIKNLLLYTLLPLLQAYLPLEQLAHLALFICFIRVLHRESPRIDDACTLAHDLFLQFYKDHDKYYVDLQNFVLHLHIHYSMMYKDYGSLCNIGCFGQEDLIGGISSNHHGTRFYGELICHYYNIDFALHNIPGSIKKAPDGPIDPINQTPNTVPYANDCHRKLCGCHDLNKCLILFRRCLIRGQLFHSLWYQKRQRSISYFIQYSSNDDSEQLHFGAIEYFFTCHGKSFALVHRYLVKQLYSEFFQTSRYFNLLKKVIDSFFFALEPESSQLIVIPMEQIYVHCIINKRNDYLIVTPISSYTEHD